MKKNLTPHYARFSIDAIGRQIGIKISKATLEAANFRGDISQKISIEIEIGFIVITKSGENKIFTLRKSGNIYTGAFLDEMHLNKPFSDFYFKAIPSENQAITLYPYDEVEPLSAYAERSKVKPVIATGKTKKTRISKKRVIDAYTVSFLLHGDYDDKRLPEKELVQALFGDFETLEAFVQHRKAYFEKMNAADLTLSYEDLLASF